MFNHISIGVSDLDRSAAFYDQALGALDCTRYMEKPGTVAWVMAGSRMTFWINQRDGVSVSPDNGSHIAFRATGVAQIDAFHAAALGAGGRDDGAPAYRPEYRENYYGAFVLDPDGHKLEAVCLTDLTDNGTQ
jgi:catechol 2,3-dioxygenase-like lactoylglutathione lyase family enzyme